MSYATVMVHVDVTGEMGAHLKLAAALADRFHARLIGISGWAPTSVFLAELKLLLQRRRSRLGLLHELRHRAFKNG